MSSSDRRAALLALGGTALGLAGCGFRPLYGGKPGEAVQQELAAIAVDAPRDRLGQIMRNEILDAIGSGDALADPRYRLVVSLQRDTDSLAIQLDSTITRYNLRLDVAFDLRQRSDDAVIYRNRVRRVASYNVRRAPYATLIAEQDAERRAAGEAAQEIAMLLSVFFTDRVA